MIEEVSLEGKSHLLWLSFIRFLIIKTMISTHCLTVTDCNQLVEASSLTPQNKRRTDLWRAY